MPRPVEWGLRGPGRLAVEKGEVVMPSESRPGRKGFYVELPDELDAQFREFVARYELGTIAQHVRMAIRRHMDAPPSVAVPPLLAERLEVAPAPEPPAEAPRKRGRPPKR